MAGGQQHRGHSRFLCMRAMITPLHPFPPFISELSVRYTFLPQPPREPVHPLLSRFVFFFCLAKTHVILHVITISPAAQTLYYPEVLTFFSNSGGHKDETRSEH